MNGGDLSSIFEQISNLKAPIDEKEAIIKDFFHHCL